MSHDPVFLCYLAGAVVTQLLTPIAMRRSGDTWREALYMGLIPLVGLLWPVMIVDLLLRIIDGPYKPKHRTLGWFE